jgi:uncharacterized protein
MTTGGETVATFSSTSTAQATNHSPQNVIFVVKVSKLCNLRCRYCYEYSQLSNSQRMSLEQLAQIFHRIDDYYHTRSPATRITFVWHGGEPMLVPPTYYYRAFELQRQIFSENIRVKNSVQTNLTILDEPRLALLQHGFDHVGVSIDLFGDLRVDAGGRSRQDVVLTNIDRLRDAGRSFGCITVLTKSNLHCVSAIYSFYEERGMNFRVLPLFPGERSDQHKGYQITAPDTVKAFQELVDLMFGREPIIHVEPLGTYIRNALLFLSSGLQPHYYRRDVSERFFIIDTDGSTYAYADVYDPTYCYGNIFRCSMEELLSSAGRQRSLEAAYTRVRDQCLHCRYYGACDGEPVTEKLTESPDIYKNGVRECIVEKSTISYIIDKIRQAELVDNAGYLVPLQ